MDAGAGPGEASALLVLEKPLNELAEEDIAQLTREDCRRYLKDKGMRRPSWNKSQAIQQVIFLKALLESPADPDDSDKPPPPPPSITITRPTQRKGATVDLTSPPKEPSPYPRRDPIPPPFAAGRERSPTEGSCPSPRISTEGAGQLTIFYGGKVNVYDGVPPDKARALMRIAASPDGNDAPVKLVCVSPTLHPARFPVSSLGPVPPLGFAPALPTGKIPSHLVMQRAEQWRVSQETEPEASASRKASLQRYLEKKKDRGRLKGKRVLGGSSSKMELVYLSQKFRVQNSCEQPNQTDASSTHPRPPPTPTRSSSMENRIQKPQISIDLNDDMAMTMGWQVKRFTIRMLLQVFSNGGCDCDLHAEIMDPELVFVHMSSSCQIVQRRRHWPMLHIGL